MYVLGIFVNSLVILIGNIKKFRYFFVNLLEVSYFLVHLFMFGVCFSLLSVYLSYEEGNLLLDAFQTYFLGPLGIHLRALVISFALTCIVVGPMTGTLGPNYWSVDHLNYSRIFFHGYTRALEDFDKIKIEWDLDYETYFTSYFFRRQMIDPSYKSNFIHSFHDSDHLSEGAYGMWLSTGIGHLVFCLIFFILLSNLGVIYQYIFWTKQERLSYKYNKLYYLYLGNLSKLSGTSGLYSYLGDLYSKELYKYSIEESLNKNQKIKNDEFYYGETYFDFEDSSRNLMLKNFYSQHVYGGSNQKFLLNQERMSYLANYGSDYGIDSLDSNMLLGNYFNNFEGQFLRGGLEVLEDKKSSFDFFMSQYLYGYELGFNQYRESANSLVYYFGKESQDEKFGDFINFFLAFISQLNLAVIYDDNIEDLGESILEGNDEAVYVYDSDDRSDHTFGWSYELEKCLEDYGRGYDDSWWISRSSLGISLREFYTEGLGSSYTTSYLYSDGLARDNNKAIEGFKKRYEGYRSSRGTFSLGDVMGARESEHDGIKRSIGPEFYTRGWVTLIQGLVFCFLYLIDEQDDYFWEGREGLEYPVDWLGLLDSFRTENIDLFYYNYFPELESFFYSQDFYEEDYFLFGEEMLDEEMPDLDVVQIDFSTFDLLNLFCDLNIFYFCFIIFILNYIKDIYVFTKFFVSIYNYYISCIISFDLIYWLNITLVGVVISVLVSIVYKNFVNWGIMLKYKFLRKN